MQIACVLIPHFCLQMELQRRSELQGKPLILVRVTGSSRNVLDHSREAYGVRAGMPLQEALAKCRDASLLEADIAAYEAAFEAILDNLGLVSPDVEPGDLGCAYIGLKGLEGIYRGEDNLIKALRAAVPQEMTACVGIAEAKFPAYLAASSIEPGCAFKVPKDVKAYLAGFSVGTLPLPWRMKEQLHRFGLHTLGQLAALPLGPVQAQFGPEGVRTWELANGIDRRLLVPRRKEEQVVESLSFPVPRANLEPILLAVESLLGRGLARPEIRSRYPRSVLLKGNIYRGPTWEKRITFKEPVSEKKQAMILIKAVLSKATLPGPLEDLTLTLSAFAGEGGRQGSLFSDVRKRDQLKETLKQLEARLGGRPPLFQVREVEPWSRIPERRRVLVQYNP